MLRRLISSLVLSKRAKRVAQHPPEPDWVTPVGDVLTRARARPGGAEHGAIVAAMRAGRDRD
jgi:hypothetical protein